MDDTDLEKRVIDHASALVDRWRLEGQWRKAYTLVHGLYPVAVAQNDEAVARLLLLEGRILVDEAMFGGQSTLPECQTVLERASVHAEIAANPALMGAIWDAQGFVQHAFYLGSDQSQEPEHEMAYFERGLLLRRAANDKRGMAESLFHIGLVYGVVRHDHVHALPYFEEAYQLAQETSDLVMASYAIRHIGFARHAADEGAGAYAAMAESLQLREAAHFVPGIAMSLHGMAYAEAAYGNKAQALVCLERAKSIFESLSVPKHVAWMTAEIEQFQQS